MCGGCRAFPPDCATLISRSHTYLVGLPADRRGAADRSRARHRSRTIGSRPTKACVSRPSPRLRIHARLPVGCARIRRAARRPHHPVEGGPARVAVRLGRCRPGVVPGSWPRRRPIQHRAHRPRGAAHARAHPRARACIVVTDRGGGGQHADLASPPATSSSSATSAGPTSSSRRPARSARCGPPRRSLHGVAGDRRHLARVPRRCGRDTAPAARAARPSARSRSSTVGYERRFSGVLSRVASESPAAFVERGPLRTTRAAGVPSPA